MAAEDSRGKVPGKRPLATARVEIVVWENTRTDGSRFVVIDVAGLARFYANVNPEAEARGIPYAVGRGVTVWLNRSQGPDAQAYFRIKCNRFKKPFNVFPPGYQPRREPLATFALGASRPLA